MKSATFTPVHEKNSKKNSIEGIYWNNHLVITRFYPRVNDNEIYYHWSGLIIK